MVGNFLGNIGLDIFFNLFGSGNIMRIYGYKTIHFMKRMDIYMRGIHFHWFGGNESTGNPWLLTVKQIVLTMFSSCSFVLSTLRGG